MTETMRALILTDDGPRFTADQPIPPISNGEALVRVHIAGICSTDLEITRGYKGGFRGVMGHEFAGEVAAVANPAHAAWIGERVAGEINIGCGSCDLCRRGLGKHCKQRSALGIFAHDGVFAEYVALPVANLHALPDAVTDEMGVFVEPLAAALEISEQLHLHPSDRVMVLGDGRLGLLVAMALARACPDTTLIGRTAEKLAIAANAGVTTAHTHELDRLAAHPADVVVEVTGSEQGFAIARQLVRPMGTIVLKSTFGDFLPSFDISALVVDEITLVGSRCGPFAPAIQLLAQGKIDPRPMIHARFPLEEGVAALAHAETRGTLKVLLTTD